MVQPDSRLFQPIMGVRSAIIGIMVVAYTIAWILIPEPSRWAIMAGILAGDAMLSAIVYYALCNRNKALLVHLSLVIDVLASTGLILCTGYAESYFPLFYLLILLAAGLLYGQTAGMYYFLGISLANVFALGYDRVFPLFQHPTKSVGALYLIMGAALPLVAFPLVLSFRLTQRGRYLDALYENISDGLLILDDIGRIVEVNGRVGQMTGLQRHELIGAPLETLVAVGEGGAGTIQTQLQRCLMGDAVSFELLLARDGREPLPVEISAQRVTGHSPGRVQAFARDISSRRLMEEEIRRQNEVLRSVNQELQIGRDIALNASRLKTQFLANMSHELRTPLNSIIGYTQFVLDDKDQPIAEDQREDLGRVLKSARHLLDMINGILDLARIESGREAVSISRFALGDLMGSVIDSVTPMAKSKGLVVDSCVHENLPELQTDEKKLRQILLNLLANAVKFTERGSVRIDCARDGSDIVCIQVTDSGIGIPAEHLDDIFSEFHQIDPSIHKQYGGTGLGLAIVKRLVELLKGTIQVESTVGRGSKFTVAVPLTLSLAHDAAGSTTVVPVRSKPASNDSSNQVVIFPDVAETVAADS